MGGALDADSSRDGGTHVRMEQSGFGPDQQAAYQGANYGWQKFFGNLERAMTAGFAALAATRGRVRWAPQPSGS
jgi:hypothetical protein